MPKRLAGVATRRSQAIASCVPAPSAGPSTAAIVGIGSSLKPRSTSAEQRGELALLDAGEVGAGAERRRRAGQHEHRVPPPPRLGVEEAEQRGVVDGVAALRSIERDDEHAGAHAPSSPSHATRTMRPTL